MATGRDVTQLHQLPARAGPWLWAGGGVGGEFGIRYLAIVSAATAEAGWRRMVRDWVMSRTTLLARLECSSRSGHRAEWMNKPR